MDAFSEMWTKPKKIPGKYVWLFASTLIRVKRAFLLANIYFCVAVEILVYKCKKQPKVVKEGSPEKFCNIVAC